MVSEPSTIRTLLSLSPLQLTFSFPLLNGLYCCCRRLLPHHRWCSPAGQPSTSCCRWCPSSTTIAFTCRTRQWRLLASFCRSSTYYENTNSSYRCSIKHPPSCFIETYEHKLSLLVNADKALSPLSRCFSLYWRLSVVSFISCFWQFCWFFLYNQPFFFRWKQYDQLILSVLLSSLSVNVLHLVVDCHTSQYCVCCTLEKALASPSNSRIMQLHGSFQNLQQGDSLVSMHAASQIVIWRIGYCWSPHVPWRLQFIYVLWP